MRRKLANKRILLTGASSGIGLALAGVLARRGARLLLTARRSESAVGLKERLPAESGEVIYLSGDITDPAHRDRLLDWVREHWGGLDILINNAGVGAVGPFETGDEERLRRILEVNFVSAAELTRQALPWLRRGDRPAILNVGSVLGHRAVPYKSEYCASKFALHGWNDALRLELAPHIDVLLISPSTTATEFFDVLLAAEGPDARLRTRAMPASKVAETAARALERGRREVILTAGGKALVWLDRLCPPLADWMIGRALRGRSNESS
ncbi:MAG TPA: SDR family NAD(P)-dependent oxidoreductase [Planctomycetaceae bacterium]|nr:SDR family NAD(P)-dependent oxidoreductase [Planctomycetaceae bacterium]